MTQRRGPRPGVRQRGNTSSYDPASGLSYRPTPTFPPEEGGKLVKAAEALNVSVSEVLRRLVQQMPVDDDGRPSWADGLLLADTGQQAIDLDFRHKRSA